MKAFEVLAKCGHVGRDYYTIKSFAVMATDKKEAARITRQFPRVKHHQKDAIWEVVEIDMDKYYELRQEHDQDPYFSCRNIQEQRKYCTIERLKEEPVEKYGKHTQEENTKTFYIGKERIRNPKKYMNRFMDQESKTYDL